MGVREENDGSALRTPAVLGEPWFLLTMSDGTAVCCHRAPSWFDARKIGHELTGEIVSAKLMERTKKMRSVLQSWVMELGLRHQGVLVAAVRGPDGLPKQHIVKRFVRAFRADTLVSFADAPASFIKKMERDEFSDSLATLFNSLDELNLHYTMHLLHAAEVIAFKHPDQNRRDCWNMLYLGLVKKLHLHPETPEQLDARLNASEEDFAAEQ